MTINLSKCTESHVIQQSVKHVWFWGLLGEIKPGFNAFLCFNVIFDGFYLKLGQVSSCCDDSSESSSQDDLL